MVSRLTSHVSRLTSHVAVCAVVLALPAAARAQSIASCTGNANEAPSPYNNAVCHGVCTVVGGNDLVCDTNAWCTAGSGDNVGAYAVQDFNAAGAHDFSIYGSCNVEGDFCCVADDTMAGVLTKVELIGTPSSNDDLFLEDGASRMRNHRNYHLDGFIRAGAGDDGITGSPFSGANYRDNLYGEDGADIIYALDGDDWVSGGAGNDTEILGPGDDHGVGDDGDDSISGDDGHDTICDSAVNSDASCVTTGGTFFDGGNDNDVIYYDGFASCPTSTMDNTSTGGPGNDTSGDNNFSVVPNSSSPTLGSGAWPLGCVDPN